MAKTDHDYDTIDLTKALSGGLRKPGFHRDAPIHGFDTETADGEVFMVTRCIDGREPEAIVGDPVNPTDMLAFLLHRKCKEGVNVWFNLSFDADQILTAILDDRELAILKTTNNITLTTETKELEIAYIPGKLLKFKSNNNVWEHYDASNFFLGASLDEACKEWLEVSKLEDVDASRFGRDKDGSLNQYIALHYDRIRKYAKRDAKLVKDLWRAFVDKAEEEYNIPCRKPYSTGYLGQAYLQETLDECPHLFRGFGADKLAFECYHGGRFETFKRGNIGPVVGPDINNAYPAVLANLPDPGSLKWLQYHSYKPHIIESSELAYVEATITTREENVIQPFEYKDQLRGRVESDALTFPHMKDERIKCIGDTFKWAVDNDRLESFTIHRIVVGMKTRGTQYPFRWVGDLYEERLREKRKGNKQAAHVLKIILNSIYGKLIQTTTKVSMHTDMDEFGEYEYIQTPEEAVPIAYAKIFEDELFGEKNEAGSFFNPHLASHITGRVRLQLMQAVIEEGLEHNTIMFATDCILVEQEPFEQSDFDKRISDELGMWDIDYEGEAFVLGAGVYEINCGDKIKTKHRGLPGLKGRPLKRSIEVLCTPEADSTAPLPTLYKRPLSMAEYLASPSIDVSEVGFFQNQSKSVGLNFDSKRAWDKIETWDKLIAGPQSSKPLTLE